MMKRPAANSSDFPPPQPPSHKSKKTREMPNLSDCHCCKRHINTTNPKYRLRILTSEWRVVLLCKNCYNLVETSQCCSYCLSGVSDSFCECKKCHRRIHIDCVSKFSFGSVDCTGDFSVCFDCWMPNMLENEYNRNRVLRSGASKKKGSKNGIESGLLASSGVCDLQEKGKDVGDVVNNVNNVVHRKAAEAIESKGKDFAKLLATKKAPEVAGGLLKIVAVDKDGDQGGVVVDEDAQLAIRLHRAMNSSPRISRNLCLLNSHCVDIPTEVVGNGLELRGHGMNGCENKSGRAQEKKSNDDSKGSWITYIRKGQSSPVVRYKDAPYCPLRESTELEHNGESECSLRESTCVDCKEEPDCSLRVSTSVDCKEELDCSLNLSIGAECKDKRGGFSRVYSRKLPRVKKRELVAGNCSKTYSRRPAHCKSKLVNDSVKLENGDCEGALANAS